MGYPRDVADAQSQGPVLRVMAAADIGALVCVQAEGAVEGLRHIFPQEQYPFPVQEVTSRWERELADPDIDCFVVLDAAEEVSGFVATQGNQFLHFGTALRTWGTGLAGQAHDEVLALFSARGHDYAWLRVFEANERARRFYSRRGWVPTGERSESGFPPNPVLLHYRIDLGAARHERAKQGRSTDVELTSRVSSLLVEEFADVGRPPHER
jgi:RimJ/RimL family protein N-acetyltransferase